MAIAQKGPRNDQEISSRIGQADLPVLLLQADKILSCGKNSPFPLCQKGKGKFQIGNVEKGRQLRSWPFVVLTYWPVRSARQSACGLSGRTFLNIPPASVCFTKWPKDSPEDENFEFFNLSPSEYPAMCLVGVR